MRTVGLLLLTAALLGCESARKHTSGTAPGVATAPAKASAPAWPLPDPERALVFAPSRYPDGNWQPKDLAVEDAVFTAADGVKLHGWYVDQTQPRAVVLYCHGNGGNVTYYADAIRKLHHDLRLAVLIFDYRGYGKSEGTPDEAGLVSDARAARAWLAERAKVTQRDVVLLGRSLGGGVAVDLAANDGTRALVLESTFTTLPDVASQRFRFLPVRSMMRYRFDSLSKIARYRGPLLQSHGEADRLVDIALGRRLHEAANPPKEFVSIPRGDHNDPQTAEYYLALRDFLDRIPPATALTR